jgi:hypothetical protein
MNDNGAGQGCEKRPDQAEALEGNKPKHMNCHCQHYPSKNVDQVCISDKAGACDFD